jgi:hypothetical protein
MTRDEKKKALRTWREQQRQTVAEGMRLVRHSRWYFVVHLDAAREATRGGAYEVQLLDEDGRGVEVARYNLPAPEVVLGGTPVPTGVLVAPSHLPVGQGCYVDETGWEVSPWGERLADGVARTTGAAR